MQTIGIYPNSKKTETIPVLHKTVQYLQEKGINVLIPEDIAILSGLPNLAAQRDTMKSSISLALTLGGDGTLLNIAKEMAPLEIPVCGINMGQLGFLTHIEVSGLIAGLERLIHGNYLLEERLMLAAVIVRNGQNICIPPALNDVVITKGSFARMIHLNLAISGQITETYPADGLIIATPTGSTGYSLSAGGPIISPNLKVTVITPICSHSLNSRSLIVSEEEEIAITLHSTHDDMALTIDGQKVYSLSSIDTILVRRSSQRALFVRFPDCGFYETLHNKLRRHD